MLDRLTHVESHKDSANRLWEQVAQICPWATFFHTPEWAAIWTRTFANVALANEVFEFEDGVVAVLPLLKHTLLYGIPWFESSLPGVYGGAIANKALTFKQYSVIENRVHSLGNVLVVGNPLSPNQKWNSPNRYQDFSHLLRIEPNYGRVECRFSQGHRTAIKSAKRRGVSVALASTLGEWNEYYQVYQDSLRRWGKKASGFYPQRLFQTLGHLAQSNNNIRLWLAKFDGQIISGAIVFYHNKHAVYWHGASVQEHLPLHGSHLVFASAIRDACESKLEVFDFNPSGGHVGVQEFKRRFGAEQVEFQVQRRINPLGYIHRLYRRMRLMLGLCPLG